MNQFKIPFKIGMEYENWEFELEILPDRLKGYDSYIYIGKKFNEFLNFSSDRTELIFNLDVLEVVIITFENKNIQFYESLNQAITNLVMKSDFELKSNFVIQKYIILDLELWCSYNYKTTYLILGKCCLINRLINSLV